MSYTFEKFCKSPDKPGIATASSSNYVVAYDKNNPDTKNNESDFIFYVLSLCMSKDI